MNIRIVFIKWYPMVLVLLAIGSVSNQSSVWADEKTIQRVLHEAPAAWERVRNSYEGTSFRVKPYRHQRSIPEYVVYIQMPNVRTEMTINHPEKGVVRNVELFNNDYRASAWDPGTGTFGLQECERRLSTDDSSGNGYVYRDAYAGLVVAGIYFPEAIVDFPNCDRTRSWGYRIDDAVELTDKEGNELISLSLKYVARDSNGKYLDVVSINDDQILASKKCFLTLSPERDWVAVEFRDEVDRSFDGVVHPMVKYCNLEYLGEVSHPVKKIEGFGHARNEKSTEQVFIYGKPKKEEGVELTSSFFRLSSLGLPEPPGFDNPNRFNWTYVFVMLVVGCVIGVVFWLQRCFLFFKVVLNPK
jgi:hypothetical protein